jgi:hypothetical protein
MPIRGSIEHRHTAARLHVDGESSLRSRGAVRCAESGGRNLRDLAGGGAWRWNQTFVRRTSGRGPDDPRPFRAPASGVLTVLSTAVVLLTTLEALAPGLGGGWFDAANLSGSQWHTDERWTYLAAAGTPLLHFLAAGVLFSGPSGRAKGVCKALQTRPWPSAPIYIAARSNPRSSQPRSARTKSDMQQPTNKTFELLVNRRVS